MIKSNAEKIGKELHATRVPTLLLGLGGIGGQIVREVEKGLRDFDKQFVRLMVLDTNVNDLSKSRSQNIRTIQTSENQSVSAYLRQNTTYLDWFPKNPLINSKNLTQGAGQIRSVSRLGMLSSEGAHRFDAVGDAIMELNRNVGDTLIKTIRVMIVGSVSGGTCSGMAIQIPFYIRELVNNLASMPRIIIRGLFIMSDITLDKQDTNAKRSAVQVNTYAFLKELNAFYHAQNFSKRASKLDIEHYNPPELGIDEDPTAMSKQVPYDFLFLVERSDINSQNIGGFDDYINRAGEIVKAQLFTPKIADDMFSTEDNLIISLVNTDGMRRYCGAGVSKAVYPEEENIRYCILRYSESVLQDYWLAIDREVDKKVDQHFRQMAVDHMLKPLDRQEAYIDTFKSFVGEDKPAVSTQFGLLGGEQFSEYEDSDPEKKTVTINTLDVAETVIEEIKEFAKGSFFDADMKGYAEDCTVKPHLMKDKDSAITNVSNLLSMLRIYEKKAGERVSKLVSSCVEAIMPSDLVSASNYSDRMQHRYCIYTALLTKHPIVARSILYKVKLELTAWMTACNNRLATLNSPENKRATVFEKDYYHKKDSDGNDPVDNPVEALSQSSQFLIFGDFNSIIKPILNDINKYSKRIKEMAELRLCAGVAFGVLERLELLIEKYELFFKELEAILIARREDRKSLETGSHRLRNSDVYVCSDQYCKDWLFREFNNQLTDASDMVLPESIKTDFFEHIYLEYAKKLKSAMQDTVLDDDELTMEQLFDQGIIEPMIEMYQDVQLSHVHMDIIQAINLEYRIHKKLGILHAGNEPVNNPEFTAEDYFISVTRQVRELARPYLAYAPTAEETSEEIGNSNDENNDIGRLLCFWGVNNGAVAKFQNKAWDNVDTGALDDMFGGHGSATVSCVNDDSFDEKELVCYCSIYDFSIENLTKYGKNSGIAKEYQKRLAVVNKGNFNVGVGRDSYLKSVHPHLDKRWHKHAYLPELFIDDEKAVCEAIRKAFIIGVSRCYCVYSVGDIRKRWAYKYNDIPLNDKPAYNADYHTLYNCLDENTIVVEEILEADKDERNAASDSIKLNGIDLGGMLNQPIIKAFIGRELTADEVADFEKAFDNTTPDTGAINILDVIFSVYAKSFDFELAEDLVQTLTDYIESFCYRMTSGRPETTELFRDEICKEISKNSKADINDKFRAMCREVCASYYQK